MMQHRRTNDRLSSIDEIGASRAVLSARGGDIPTETPLTGASNAGEVGKKRDPGRIAGCIGQHIYRVTLIGVFFRINLHQTRTQYSNEGQQHWNAAQYPKNAF